MQTERVTFLTTPGLKANLAARAAAIGVSVGEYVRRRIEDDDDQMTPQQEAELTVLVEEVNRAIPRMHAAFDEMNAALDETHAEVDRTLRAAGIRR